MAESSRARAQKLMIELMSYQFASPVRWIETQNVLFAEEEPIERYVEIGPSTVLTTMAKKTAAKWYKDQSASRWANLQFLSYAADQSAIYYSYPEEAISGAETVPTDVSQAVEAPVAALSIPIPAAVTSTPIAAKSVPTISLSASNLVLALTAQKLRRGFDQVTTDSTIAELAGGKSTLQNELIGDLEAEFGRLPDSPESIALSTLGEGLQAGFSGKPGKVMAVLLSKLTSSKMPAGFNQVAMQDYLLFHWGLSKEHSVIPLCFAVTAEPASRLSSLQHAKEYLDGLALRYAAFANIQLLPATSGGDLSSTTAATLVDASGLEALKVTLQREQSQAMARLAGRNGLEEDGLAALKASQNELTEKLDQWDAEFDASFFEGIQSVFNARHGRTYASSWNWARENLLHWITGDTSSRGEVHTRRLLNQWDSGCGEIIRFALDNRSATLSPNIVEELRRLAARANGIEQKDPTFWYSRTSLAPQTTITNAGDIEFGEVARATPQYSRLVGHRREGVDKTSAPFVHLRRRHGNQWQYDAKATALYLDKLALGSESGLSYAGKTVLVTGAGRGSIGAEVVQALLSGGARVIVTTSKAVSSTADSYRDMYHAYGARGSSLTLLPFNQASRKDCEALVKHLYSTLFTVETGDLDYIVPFAAIPDTGEVDEIDSKSEMAHRAMLINLLRLLGCIRAEKERQGIDTKPTTIILPLSPNHGQFGGDGLYSESKLGLETLFNRFYSEKWSNYLTVCGAVIGWTRGTGLMSANNLIADAIECHDMITFSQQEMAFNLVALMTPEMSLLCDDDPVYADLTGGLQDVKDLKNVISMARSRLSYESQLRKALIAEEEREQAALQGYPTPATPTILMSIEPKKRRANLNLQFPPLPDHQTLTGHLSDLKGMIDLSRTVVIVGFAELGPWGSARTRWDMEQKGELSLEGYTEIAWIMGLVKHVDGELKGQPFVGWVDTATQQPIKEEDIQQKHGDFIKQHSGLRFIEPEGLGGFNPAKKESLHEVVVEEDLPPFECSRATAEAFKLQHGDKVITRPVEGSEEYMVQIKKGVSFLVPKANASKNTVGGQLPKGWDPKQYGIPSEIIQQVDAITLYALCCIAEAMLSAGIQDPYELYHHIHISELANCVGTCFGGFQAARNIYKERYLDRPVANDTLQEYFLNTMSAWINMLMLSSTGPIKTPVGACATAIESIDLGCAEIQSGKCKVAIVGGSDDLHEEVSYEFRNMKATANTIDELANGRLPREMSRPSTSSRAGFIEAAGCGVQIIMSAELALEMGLPIHGVVAYTQMAGDQIGRSVPAPGKGIMTAARESVDSRSSELFTLEYRQQRLKEEVATIRHWRQEQSARVQYDPVVSAKQLQEINQVATAKLRAAQKMWANELRDQQPSIAPIKAAMTTWGLTVDDIQVASMHGTSTKANDTNEADVIHQQMQHMGRQRGNPLLVVCQKSLTGHPKGAAGSWQLHGCLQILQNGTIPGNHNADDIEVALRPYNHMIYLQQRLQLSEVQATMLTSFGFGQKSAIAIIVHPRHLFAATTQASFEDYRTRTTARQRISNVAWIKRLHSNTIFQAKTQTPWQNSPAATRQVFLDPGARATQEKDNSWVI